MLSLPLELSSGTVFTCKLRVLSQVIQYYFGDAVIGYEKQRAIYLTNEKQN